jgi:putative acetyltransferase
MSALLRFYRAEDEAAAIQLWLRSWQAAFPQIDFPERLDWWRTRWRNELVPSAAIVVAEEAGALTGFVTVDAETGYLDQIVVAPERWGSPVARQLMTEAKRIAPRWLDLHVNCDNARALRFYEKHGFRIIGGATNPHSGRPVHLMRWRAEP